MHSTFLLVVVVITALGLDFTNGFHDTANVVAASISTRALARGRRPWLQIRTDSLGIARS